MSKGFVVLAQNNDVDDYLKMAYALAISLRNSQPTPVSISLITDKKVSKKIKSVFDQVLILPKDNAKQSSWKIENRTKIYGISPYDETIVLDVDMLVLTDISSYWDILKKYDLYFTSKVLTYRGEPITKDNYRRVFTTNNLPNLYTGMHYFKKSEFAENFYTLMEIITNNWQEFYSKFLTKNCPKNPSMDVTAALTAKILECSADITSSELTFVHMKPALQDWHVVPDEWTSAVGSYFNANGNLKIGNFLQEGVFHYTEKKFLSDDIVSQLEQLWKC